VYGLKLTGTGLIQDILYHVDHHRTTLIPCHMKTGHDPKKPPITGSPVGHPRGGFVDTARSTRDQEEATASLAPHSSIAVAAVGGIAKPPQKRAKVQQILSRGIAGFEWSPAG
jgi:hypothetical protein